MTATTQTKNMAAWLTSPKSRPFTVAEAPMPVPGPDEVLVRVRAVALNPVDWFIQNMGIIVVSVGANVANTEGSVAPGDRVCGLAGGHEAGDYKSGAFQLYAKANKDLLTKIPDEVSYAQAAVLPLGMSTAATALFQKDAMALPLPGTGNDATTLDKNGQKKVLLVWGGRSSVGSCGIQLAVAAGFDVATTASARNREYCEGIGAKWVLDYHGEEIEDEIVEALARRECVGVFDAWSRGSIAQCARVVLRLDENGGVGGGRKVVQTVLPGPEQITEELPEGVEIGYTYGTTLVRNEVGPAVWGKWVPEALATGALQCKPDPEVVAKGLEGIQTACDIGSKGWGTNSSPKLVVELD
ncbi:alcohol dehydrogenase [Apiospora saccharicola]|uniref:Alcohol dehydrogenase n=1 Tax=Apiospora saccharicola TaxID=335842 RepID=A0ABR1UZJ7_9PEZI